jgi:hypothetical protein
LFPYLTNVIQNPANLIDIFLKKLIYKEKRHVNTVVSLHAVSYVNYLFCTSKGNPLAKATFFFFFVLTFNPQKMDRNDELFNTRSALKRKGE